VCVLPGTATGWLYILRNTSKVQDAYHEDGTPADKEATDKRTGKCIEELLWCMEAVSKMK
jgi:hypothetical protein